MQGTDDNIARNRPVRRLSSEIARSRRAASQELNHNREWIKMSWYCDVERELAHIRGAIELLEQTHDAFTNRSLVSDPAYWRVKLDTLRTRFERNKVLEYQINELFARLDRIRDPNMHK
ncbi:hypothetical protein [Burkholderia sp. S-53]|uniref:hypothetical protein n=1 Tax=Burkholderia sp. S-53 TaxID=2906514 RepID=UPI0021D3DF93|nr:hypothetical protein [Burkholderia sp. S-53]UXU90638.1 hypothetical protein LXM88_35740 [Burkholderia sp. S-53]